MPRVILSQDPDYEMSAEIVDDLVFVHLDIFKWSPSTRRRCYKWFRGFLHNLEDRGVDSVYCAIKNGNTKLDKFAKLYGFEDLFEVDNGKIAYRSTDTWAIQ